MNSKRTPLTEVVAEYVGAEASSGSEVPPMWAGFGAYVAGMPLEEALEASELDWKITRAPLLYCVEDEEDYGTEEEEKEKRKQERLQQKELEEKGLIEDLSAYVDKKTAYRTKNQFAMVESKTHTCLGVVTSKYIPTQPQSLLRTAHDFCEDKEGFEVEYAGHLEEKRRLWVLISTGDVVNINSNDPYKSYLLLSTTNDSNSSTKFSSILLRVATGCTLEVPNSTVTISHNFNISAHELTKHLPRINKARTAFIKLLRQMGKTKPDYKTAMETMIRVMANEDKDVPIHVIDEKMSSRKRNQLDLALNIYKGMAGTGHGANTKSAGTVLHLLMSCCEYIDFFSPNYTEEFRVRTGLFTTGMQAKMKMLSRVIDTFDLEL